MNNAHNTQEELALYAMQELPVEDSSSIRTHLQICPSCCKDLAEVCGDLLLIELAVRQREIPQGSRLRFTERLATSPRAHNALAAVPALTEKQESRGNNGDDPHGHAKIFAISVDRVPCHLHAAVPQPDYRTVAGMNPMVQKKSLLRMKMPASMTTRNGSIPHAKVDTAKPTVSRVVAARVVGIFWK